ncbi:MAG: TlpA family protein disulfide reductase [Firmicutes bacterium]|nr:TlpA family protein disulfide reductase [Bacillota bacterium]MBQ9605263.1 TlpA family protein disulfide reductase [Bacillota bacterium]
MKNKLAFLLLAAGFACAAFSGCSSGSPAESSGTASQSVSQSGTKKLTDLAAEDIDGNEFSLNDTISGGKVTMINVWGTFCGPCLSEMPALESLNQKYKNQGLNIVGMTCDINYNGEINQEASKDAKEIRKELGITYPLIVETSEMDALLPTDVVPATFFFDSNGNQIGDTVFGSQSEEDWEKLIKSCLAAQG